MSERISKRKRATQRQLDGLRAYARDYRARGVKGVWWDHMLDVEAVLREIDDRRRSDDQ
jgi:hypothetical protein